MATTDASATPRIKVSVCKTSAASASTVNMCTWCRDALGDMERDESLTAKMKQGASGDNIKELHEHMLRFGFAVELSDSSSGKQSNSEDLSCDKWGAYTTRAVRLFAAHPRVMSERESTIKSDGKTLTQSINDKIREWCKTNTTSPKNYWDFKGWSKMPLMPGAFDAYGADVKKKPETQTFLHDFIKQIEGDLAATGFGVHADTLCGLGKAHKATGHYPVVKRVEIEVSVRQPNGTSKTHIEHRFEDRNLTDLGWLIRRFQTQAKWRWRMKGDGTQLEDATDKDPSLYTGPLTGEWTADMDLATATCLHAWESKELHAVTRRFGLKDLNWPPSSTIPLKNAELPDPSKLPDKRALLLADRKRQQDKWLNDLPAAQLRQDAHDAWLAAAEAIYAANATIAGPYASSPRGWTGGKPESGRSNSQYSRHYAALAVDLNEDHWLSDGSVGDRCRYVVEEDDKKFRIWCWVVPNPAPPADIALDKADPVTQYRNRNIVPKKSNVILKHAGAHTDATPLYNCTLVDRKPGAPVTAKEGWYVDVTQLLENHGMNRIARHEKDWDTAPTSWEWWHYEFSPALPPGAADCDKLMFGDFLQMFGVHEYLLRQNKWSAHDDIMHPLQ